MSVAKPTKYKTNPTPHKTESHEEYLNRLIANTKSGLESWNMLTEAVSVPADIAFAFQTSRPELMKLVKPRDITADEHEILINLISVLIGTNIALKQHAEAVSRMMESWHSMVKGQAGMSQRIMDFAAFRQTVEDSEATSDE